MEGPLGREDFSVGGHDDLEMRGDGRGSSTTYTWPSGAGEQHYLSWPSGAAGGGGARSLAPARVSTNATNHRCSIPPSITNPATATLLGIPPPGQTSPASISRRHNDGHAVAGTARRGSSLCPTGLANCTGASHTRCGTRRRRPSRLPPRVQATGHPMSPDTLSTPTSQPKPASNSCCSKTAGQQPYPRSPN